ncbi:MAG: hypothetical protein ACD_19C00016G0023 [uncultured bacterium]|nr:MAG: hypothetical protein ACD_19C00016G0023 [uncultured bacterium]
MKFMNKILTSIDLAGKDFDDQTFESSKFTGANINSVGFENSNIDKTILDVSGFISYGNSKGFVLTS